MTDPKEFFDTYCDFVTKVTSNPSLDIKALKASLQEIQDNSDIDVPRLMTAALGLSSEGGEFVEIVKRKHISYEKRAWRHHVVLGYSLYGP